MKLICICAVIAFIVAYAGEMKVKVQGFQCIYSYSFIHDLSWSADGSLLSFAEGYEGELDYGLVISSDTNTWYECNPSTETVTMPAQWPRQPELSGEEIALYQPATQDLGSLGNAPSYLYLSPNKDYIVYASNIGVNGWRFPIYIADLQRQITAETHTETWNPTRGTEYGGFNVIWNRTSTAFMVSTTLSNEGYTGQHVQAYGGNFSKELADLKMTSTDEIRIDGHQFWPTQAYSISDDGDYVLLRAVDVDRNYLTDPQKTYYLIIWNVATNTSAIIGNMETDEIRAVAFDNGDSDKILMFNATGVVRYVISTGDTTIITTQINADWAARDWPILWSARAAFSSDGQRLAVIRAENEAGVYIFNLSEDF